jgi:hypothetical protein
MSFDLYIYFPQAAFPVGLWHDILASFRSEACHVRFEETDPEFAASGAKHCYLVADDSVVSVGISRKMDPDAPPDSCVPKGTHWLAGVSTGMGRSALASRIQFAIPYHALVFMPGVSVHDCQYHQGRSTEASSWSDADAWLEYCRTRPSIAFDLFSEDGTLRF